MDIAVKAGVVRNEVAEVLKSDRLNLLGSCEAHVFKLDGGKWLDLTDEPVLVHLIRDNLEGVTKMLAVSTHKLIINNVPVSSNFNVFAPSKKFIQFVCNKFDKNTENYGFGFAGVAELEMFLQLLNKIKHAAMASLTPSFHSALVPPQTPRSVAARATDKQTILNYAPTGVPGFGVPYGYAASPMKDVPQTPLDSFSLPTDPRSFLQEQAGLYQDEESSSRSSYSAKSNDVDKMPSSPSDDQQFDFVPDINTQGPPRSPALPADPLNEMHAAIGVPPGISARPDPLYAFAERRLCDLIASFESKPLMSHDEALATGDFVEHPVGPIGSPIKKISRDADR